MAAFPAIWHTRPSPLIIAHRGASHAAPQNTLAAFRVAAEQGADGVELDVQLSADGVPVVIHDADVSELTDGVGRVYDLTLVQIKALDAGSHFSPEFAGEPIPTLEEVLVALDQRLLVNIELKYQPKRVPQLAAAVAAVVRRTGAVQRVWFSSFRPYALQAIRRLVPEVPCGFLYGGSDLAKPLFTLITPHEALHPQAHLVRPYKVAHAHRRGQRVMVWTVDNVEQAQQLAVWGVDALITNEPARLLVALGR